MAILFHRDILVRAESFFGWRKKQNKGKKCGKKKDEKKTRDVILTPARPRRVGNGHKGLPPSQVSQFPRNFYCS